MWECSPQILDGGNVHRYTPLRDGTPVPYRRTLRLWREDAAFQSFFISLLLKSPFSSYRLETPPITTSTADREFEFVLLDDPALDRAPDPQAFAEQFRSALPKQQVVSFPNLGGDAQLVVPCPAAASHAAYVHLASFVRQSPEAQVHELWRVVAATMQARLGDKPTWLSTAGIGVAWLHVRLDSRPKYYGFRPYRDEA